MKGQHWIASLGPKGKRQLTGTLRNRAGAGKELSAHWSTLYNHRIIIVRKSETNSSLFFNRLA